MSAVDLGGCLEGGNFRPTRWLKSRSNSARQSTLGVTGLTAICLSASAGAQQVSTATSLGAREATATVASTPPDAQQDTGQPTSSNDIVVTARRRTERLQDVPDAVTAFTSATIEKAGIQSFGDFANLTPNLTFEDASSYSAGESSITLRGIGNGQQGWPSVSFLVDGVPLDSLDSLADGTLTDIERIEVLRGPQSALYGFNAIAGAINLITRRPTNAFHGQFKTIYASGDDKSVLGTVSGPIAKDLLLFRLSGYLRDAKGLITSASNGRKVDPVNQKKINGELLFTPDAAFELGLKGEYNNVVQGSTYQAKILTADQFNDFSPSLDPRRRLIGRQGHEVYQLSMRAIYHAPFADLISITAYTHTNQDAQSSLCYDDPDSPLFDAYPATPGAQAGCIFKVPVFGSAAVSGQPVDQYFLALEQYRTFFQDLRLQSTTKGRLNWTIGANYLSRNAFNGFDAGLINAPAAGGAGCANGFGLDLSRCGALTRLFPRWDARSDRWWGIYGQASYDITDKLQLTVAGRYDSQRYRSTQYTDRERTTIVQAIDTSGGRVDSQNQSSRRFQPKAQLSYKLLPDVMAYAVYSEGYRAGFFNTGQFTRPESTKNYEGGVKSSFEIGGMRAVVNVAAFHIDYSDQQFSKGIATPPFRIAVTIPKTSIDGMELEATLHPSRALSLTGSAGYLNAKVADGTRAPFTPHWTLIGSADYAHPLAGDLGVTAHIDFRHNSSLYLTTGNQQLNPARSYLNLRGGLTWKTVSLTGFVKNATDERDVPRPIVALSTGGFVRFINLPRQYGVQLDVQF